MIYYLLPVDRQRLLEDLNDNFMVKIELTLDDRYGAEENGKYMAIASAALITTKNVGLNKKLSEEDDKNKKEVVVS